MAQKQKKKRRVGLTIFLVILALIILLPVGLFIYLSAEHFPIAKMQAEHPYTETYTGFREYGNGQVSLQLDEAEVYWLAEYYELSELEIPMLTLNGYAVELEDDSAQLYADLTFAEFLPLPVYAKVSFGEAENETVPVIVEEAKLGKWLPVPLKLLEKFGVDLNISLDLNEELDGYRFTSLSLSDGLLHASVELEKSYGYGFAPDRTAETLLFYGADSEYLSAASDCFKTRGSSNFDVICGAEDAARTVTHLLALSPDSPEAAYMEKLTEIDLRYMLPVSADEVVSLREAYTTEIAEYNRKLQSLLDGVRSTYAGLGLYLAADGYQDAATGEPFSVSAIVPELGIADEDFRLMLLTATDPIKHPLTADLPPFSEIPRQSDQVPADAMKNVPYDIGVMLPMPSGDHAMLYYVSTGEMVIQAIPDAMVAEMLETYAVPNILNLDFAIYGVIRFTSKAPAEDLADYIVFLPDAVEDVYRANND